jgi:hypothetical protein
VFGGVLRPCAGGDLIEFQVDDVLAALGVPAGTGAADLVAADDRPVQKVCRLSVCRTGDQRQIGVVVAGQDVVVIASGRLELQTEQLNLLLGALPQCALVGDGLRRVAGGAGTCDDAAGAALAAMT